MRKILGIFSITALLLGLMIIPASADHNPELTGGWFHNGDGDVTANTDGSATMEGSNQSIENNDLGIAIETGDAITLDYDGFCTAGAPRVFVQVGATTYNTWDGNSDGDCGQGAANPDSGTIEYTYTGPNGTIGLAGIVNDTTSERTVTVSNLTIGEQSVSFVGFPEPDAGDPYDETAGSDQAGQCEGEAGARKWDTNDGQYDGHIVFDGDIIDVVVDGKTITFSQSVEFCVKGSNNNSGRQSGSSYTVDFENQGGNHPDISNFVLYLPDDNGEEPETCPEDSDVNAGEEIPDGETAESFCSEENGTPDPNTFDFDYSKVCASEDTWELSLTVRSEGEGDNDIEVALLPHGGGDEGSGEEAEPFFETTLESGDEELFGSEFPQAAVLELFADGALEATITGGEVDYSDCIEEEETPPGEEPEEEPTEEPTEEPVTEEEPEEEPVTAVTRTTPTRIDSGTGGLLPTTGVNAGLLALMLAGLAMAGTGSVALARRRK